MRKDLSQEAKLPYQLLRIRRLIQMAWIDKVQLRFWKSLYLNRMTYGQFLNGCEARSRADLHR